MPKSYETTHEYAEIELPIELGF